MEGAFARKKIGFGLLMLVVGVPLISGNLVLVFINESAVLDALILGVVFCIVGIFSLTLNRGAYVHADEAGIRARFHWFGRLDCRMDQVTFAEAEGFNTLAILLKNGKQYRIMGLSTPLVLAHFIQRQIFSMETETPDRLREMLAQAQAAMKKTVWWVIGGCVAMFANISLAVAATGSREFEDFSTRDQAIFWPMMGVELLIVVGVFGLAVRAGKRKMPILHLQYRLRGAEMAAQPLLPGCIVAVYTDCAYRKRITVYGFPASESVYYCVERFAEDGHLKPEYTSNVYDSFAALRAALPVFSEFADITYLWQ